MKIIGYWVVDFSKQIAYARTKHGYFIRRNPDGSKEILKELPLYVTTYLLKQAIKSK